MENSEKDFLHIVRAQRSQGAINEQNMLHAEDTETFQSVL